MIAERRKSGRKRTVRRAAALPVYTGPFGNAQAERLLWRAGFGPRPGDVASLAGLGLDGAVYSLTRPPAEQLVGPTPNDKGQPIQPTTVGNHDYVWWLDRMVRSNQQLVERMTLVFHDWFATRLDGVGSREAMINQNQLFRRYALGNFGSLLQDVTIDPAMLLWLSGAFSVKGKPNENYAREMMELFSLGADRGAYTEDDVREHARALTGWRYTAGPNGTTPRAVYDATKHDGDPKRIFGQTGNFDWRDSVRLNLQNSYHPSFLIRKLWSYFVPTPPDASTQAALEQLYTSGRYELRPLLEAILRHPDFYGPARMVKPPVVLQAGMLRALGRGIDTSDWAWYGGICGQLLFQPPNVAGWDDDRWLDTGTFMGRWQNVVVAIQPFGITASSADGQALPLDANQLLTRALAFWGNPTLCEQTLDALRTFANNSVAAAYEMRKRRASPNPLTTYPTYILNALRQLIAASPDYQTC